MRMCELQKMAINRVMQNAMVKPAEFRSRNPTLRFAVYSKTCKRRLPFLWIKIIKEIVLTFSYVNSLHR